MQIAFGQNAKDNVPRQRDMTFEQFVRFVRGYKHTGSLSFAEYSVAGKLGRGRDKDCMWFIPALFVRPLRRATAVGSLSGFVCDFDDGAINRAKIEAALSPLSYIAWTSYSHGVGGLDKWRVYIPYDAPIDPKDHKAIYEHFNTLFDGHLDPRCATVSQLWYLPGHPRDAGGHAVFAVVDGLRFIPRPVGNNRPPTSARIGGQPPVRALATGVSANAELSGRAPASLRDIENALNEIDPTTFGSDRYTEWVTLAMAVFDGTQGSHEGYNIFDTWSRRIPGYEAEGIAPEKWQSFGTRGDGPRITVATLFKKAKDAAAAGSVNRVPDNAPVDPPAPASRLLQPQQAAGPQHSNASGSQPTQLVLPLTSPVPMPDTWRNHPTSLLIQKQVDDPNGSGNHMWKTVIRGFHLQSFELLKTVEEETHTAQLVAVNRHDTESASFDTAIMGTPEFQGLLNSRGIFCQIDEFKELKELLMEWLKKIKDQDRVKKSFTHYGWMEKEGVPVGFAAGDTAYYTNGTKESGIKIATRVGGPHAPYYIPQGRMQPWRNVVDFLIGQQNQSLLAVLATSFASPLMKFSGHSGAVVSIVSAASGVGKTSVLLASQAVWSKPVVTVHSATDTILSLTSKMGFTKNLPAYWDDIKGSDKMWGQFSETIYQITQGKEKSRLDSNANPRPLQDWCCLAIIAANDSIFEVMKRYSKGNTDAGVARVFELRLEERPTEVKPSTFFDQCKNNYGWAGAEYAAWLAAHRDAAERAVIKKTAQLSAELTITSEERFWIAAMSTMIVGAGIAKLLKLVDFDVPALEEFLKTRFYQLRSDKNLAAAEAGIEDRINSLIYDHQQTTLVVDTIPRFNSGSTMIIRPPRNQEVEITFIKEDQILRVRRTKFNEWCAARGLSPETLRIALDQRKAVKERNVDPMVGMKPYTLDKRVACYDIDLKALGVTGDVDGTGT